jgi:hypothetical protein
MVRWRYLDASGAPSGSSDEFGDRESAEAWLGETWAELLDEGVEAVELVEGDRVRYRMGLRET